MIKNNAGQLELFQLDEQGGKDFNNSGRPKDPLHLGKVREYQKLILSLLACIFIGMASYSLGFEKGRKLIVKAESGAPVNASSPRLTPDIPDIKKDVSYLLAVSTQPGAKAVISNAQKPIASSIYTIQVASISQSENVKKELSNLKNKGYSAFSLSKGKYMVICVGRFNVKTEAQNNLEKLKNKYPDCQIRRL